MSEQKTDCPRCGAAPMEDQSGDSRDWCECWDVTRDQYPFNGSNDPVYQETMEHAQESVSAALVALRGTLDQLDGHDETEPEHEALARVVHELENVAGDKFDLSI